MFKPRDPDEPLVEPVVRTERSGSFDRLQLMLGAALLISGLGGLIYGSLMESQTRPDEGEGLLAGLLGGLVASLGEFFQSLGWVLAGLGCLVLLMRWMMGRAPSLDR